MLNVGFCGPWGVLVVTFFDVDLELRVVLSHFLDKLEIIVTEGSLRACRCLSPKVFTEESSVLSIRDMDIILSWMAQ